MNDAEGEIRGGELAEREEDGSDELEESDGVDGGSQPLDLNSEEIRLRIIESGTRFPDCIAASAWTPFAAVSHESILLRSSHSAG